MTASGKREHGARCERQGCSPGAAAACSCHCPVTQTCHPAVTSVLTPLPLTVLFSVGKLGENWFLSVTLAMQTSDISFPARPCFANEQQHQSWLWLAPNFKHHCLSLCLDSHFPLSAASRSALCPLEVGVRYYTGRHRTSPSSSGTGSETQRVK